MSIFFAGYYKLSHYFTQRGNGTSKKEMNDQLWHYEVFSKNIVDCDDIRPNQNVTRNGWAWESPVLGSMFSMLENNLEFSLFFVCIGICMLYVCACTCEFLIWCACMFVCVCVCSRSWWVRTQMEREWWLTSQLMTNPYPACNSTPVVRHTHWLTHTHRLTQFSVLNKRQGEAFHFSV